MFRILMTITALACFCAPLTAAELVAPSTLGASFFDAKPITTTDSKGRTSRLVFTPDGTLTRTSTSGRASEGKWRLSEDGFCMQVGKAKSESCYIVLKRDDGTISALRRSGQPFTWQK